MKSKGTDRIAEQLRKIVEEMEDLGVGELDAWKGLAGKLSRLLKKHPEAPPPVPQVIEASVRVLENLAQQPAQGKLESITQLCNVLEASESFLRGALDAVALENAGRGLDAVPPECAPAAAAEEGGIDDAAALLVQLEIDDRSGWQRLGQMLRRLASKFDAAEAGLRYLEEAGRLAEVLAGGASDAPEEQINAIGVLLEAVAGGRSPAPEPVHPEPAAPDHAPEPLRDYMPADYDADLMREFVAESTDLIQKAEEALLTLENDPEDTEAVGRVFRAFHTVKGTAGFLDLTLIAELGHHAETLLSRVRDGEIRYSGGYADLSLQALDAIKGLVADVERALTDGPLRMPDGYDTLLQVIKNPEAAGVTEDLGSVPTPRIGDLLIAEGKVDRRQVEDARSRHPHEKLGVALVRDKAASLADVGQALRTQKQLKAVGQPADSSVRVSTQRLDRLIDMVGELVIAHSMIAQDHLVVSGENHALAKKIAHSAKIVRELQDISMSMRMVPFKATFSKMARLVRDVARKLGKNVDFRTEGEDTEIDRNLVDIINDPLVHMVRNAVDHGIESPEERQRRGKPENGTVIIRAFHSAGSVVVEISDDGKGLDREVILAKARERGLVGESADTNERSMSDREVFNLLFEPGFSTAEIVTDVSGRGVGMDVVKKNIELLRGQVEIKSEPGRGSLFRMSLPLTLAIIDGMVIRVGRETYVLPTISIVRSVKPAPQEISTVFQQGELLRLQDRMVPLYRLARLFGIAGAKEDLNDAIVAVVEDEDRLAGLVIDELVGRHQVVIKNLGESMKNIPGISGGAIMPDGRVGLILDVGGLLRFATPERRDEGGAVKSQPLAA